MAEDVLVRIPRPHDEDLRRAKVRRLREVDSPDADRAPELLRIPAAFVVVVLEVEPCDFRVLLDVEILRQDEDPVLLALPGSRDLLLEVGPFFYLTEGRVALHPEPVLSRPVPDLEL